MNTDDYHYLRDYMRRRLLNVTTRFHRFLYQRINWSVRLIGIKGARGVGKTTMLLQRILECHPNLDDTLYVSLDTLWFETHSLEEVASYCVSHDILNLYIDEIHRYPTWAIELKSITDLYPDLKIVYTGSSLLHIDNSKVDLSRRQTVYFLPGMSFREFMEYEGLGTFEDLTLNDILSNHTKIASTIAQEVKVLPAFERYQKEGHYPFYKETGADFPLRLSEVVNTVIDIDLPSTIDITFATVEKARKLMMVLSQSLPQMIKLGDLFRELETTRDLGLKLLDALERAQLLLLLSSKQKNYKRLTIPEKIYLQNGNLMYALSKLVNLGTLREAFFINSLRQSHDVTLSKNGDFLVDGKYTFEVGGAGKTFDQIADIPNSYLAVDNTEVGYGAKIPLWLLGFLY